jgi:N-carbamoylputrescine amidase
MMKKLTVASVQMISRNNDFDGNIARARALIEDAVAKGAKLILLPEVALIGYLFDDPLWKEAEPLKGRTFIWLKELCTVKDIFIGTCILEKDGEDFFDTFILVGPGEEDFWSHRKIEPASYEAYFFKGRGLNPNVFDTPIGRIGISICFDSSKTHTLSSLIDGKPEILLITYSCPELPWFILPGDRKNWIEVFEKTAEIYSGFLPVPLVISNKTGPFISPIPLMPLLRANAPFVGRSTIVDRNGHLLSTLKEATGVLVEEVELGYPESPRKSKENLPKGRWLLPYSNTIKFLMDLSYRMGKLRYTFSARRKEAARKIANS